MNLERLCPLLFRPAATAGVVLAAFLSFTVQPMVGKALLPVQGGSAATWLGVMLYFQAALLVGYGWAFWALGGSRRRQLACVAGLCLLAMATTRLGALGEVARPGVLGVFWALCRTTLPAMLLLFGVGPLMHGWLRGSNAPIPYHVYALSSIGGIVAVAAYPFFVETHLGLGEQMFFWNGFLWVVAGLVASSALLLPPAIPPAAREKPEPLSYLRGTCWFLLSMLACIVLLAATHHLSAEIGSSPLAWVGPFVLYLAGFAMTFSGWWRSHHTVLALIWLAVSLSGFIVVKGLSNATVDGMAVFWLLSLTGAASTVGSGLLHELRPNLAFGRFYLAIAAGGVAGGLFSCFAAPALFRKPSELLVAACLLLTYGLWRVMRGRSLTMAVLVAAVVGAPAVSESWKQLATEREGALRVWRLRNIYGCATVRQEESGLVLSSETTTHGTQITTDDQARRQPTLYYTESSAVGTGLQVLRSHHDQLRIAAVGLGAGTLAAYGQPGDQIDFWEIDPKAIRIAQEHFSYLRDCAGQWRIMTADGRLGLASSTDDYDVIVIDAFCGDGVPAHLLTQEALGIYARRLERRSGILLVHISNRYSRFFPIIGRTASFLGWSAVNVTTDIAEPTDSRDWDAAGIPSQYVMVCPSTRLDEVLSWFPAEEDEGRVTRHVTVYVPPAGQSYRPWTDDRHASIEALDVGAYLKLR